MNDADLVAILFRRAAAHRISMATLCRHARVDPTTPSRWRRNRNGASLDRVVRLHAALDQLIRNTEAGDASADDRSPGNGAS